MLYDESTASSLRPWLVRTLQPICDADPEALADYVLALLKHDAAEPELRKMFVSQLEEFLEKEAAKFVDTLFAALRTKSYMPYEPVKADSVDSGIPIPIDALMSSSDRGRKRSLDDDAHDHPPPKGPRLGGDSHFSRYSPSNGRMLQNPRNGINNRGGQMNGRGMGRAEGSSMNGHMQGMEGSQMYRPPGNGFAGRGRRGICRDYHNNGFCARGSLCQFSHGEDAVIPPMPYGAPPGLVNGIPGGGSFIPMFGGGAPFVGMPGATYDPHEAHMEMGGSRPARGPRGPDNHSMQEISSVELPVIQDLTPRDPVEEAARGDAAIQPNGFTHNFGTPRRTQQQQMNMMPLGNTPNNYNGGIGGHIGVPPMVGGQVGGGIGHLGGGGGGHMGGGMRRQQPRGVFTGERTFQNGPRDDKTLVVEKIPEDKLTLETVNEWFKRFGTVTNVAIDSPSAKALVSFSNHEEARAAWKSEDAVFGNRFVKLFWHRPMEGHGGFGQRALAASAPLVRNMATSETPTHVPAQSQPQSHPQPQSQSQPQATSVTPAKTPQKPDPATVAALAARQQLLERQISEQKVLMSRLSTATTPEEKQEIMARIRSIQNGMMPSTPLTPQPSTSKISNGASKTSLSEKERLDKELEMHQTALKSTSEGASDEATTTAVLKEKLARLKAEATRLGVPDSEINAAPEPSSSTSYRPYRGRGFRARGFTRGGVGRGGASRSSMKLDNRPRKILIQGVPASDESVQAVRTHYQDMGNLESFWNLGEGQIVVQFWSRSAAEQAMANAPDIPSVGKVKVGWHTGPTPASTTPPLATTPSLTDSKPSHENTERESDVKMSEIVSEEHEDGGWGQAYDDEDEGRRRRSRSNSFS